MKKIEFDTVNGAYEVSDFDQETNVVDGKYVFEYFKDDFEGTRGAEVDMVTFRKIDSEYGIEKLSPTVREIGQKGGINEQ